MAENANGNAERSPVAVVKESVKVNLAVVPITALMQPLIFVRTLSQIGHEPLEPVLGKSLFFRRPCYYYPNLFQYANHMRKTEGAMALFTGFTPKVCNVVLSTVTEAKVDKLLREMLPYTGESAKLPIDKKDLKNTLYEIAVSCTAKSAGVIVSHPFHVVMVRMICSVINKDESYRGIRATLKEIYESEGIGGFFSGFMPRWLAEMVVVSLGGTIMYAIYRLMSTLDVEEEAVRRSTNYNAIVQGEVEFGLSSMVYKYQLTSVVSAASCKGLHIGLPNYHGWRSVLNHLSESNQLQRGAPYFYRKAIV